MAVRIEWRRTPPCPRRRAGPYPDRSGRRDRPQPRSRTPSTAGTPAQVHRLRAPLTAHQAYRLALDDRRLRIDARRGAVAEAVAHGLGEVAQELVVVVQAVVVDAEHGAVVGDADQEVAALGVEERGDGLERGVRDVLVILAVLLQVQRRLDLNSRVFDSWSFRSSSTRRCRRM